MAVCPSGPLPLCRISQNHFHPVDQKKILICNIYAPLLPSHLSKCWMITHTIDSSLADESMSTAESSHPSGGWSWSSGSSKDQWYKSSDTSHGQTSPKGFGEASQTQPSMPDALWGETSTSHSEEVTNPFLWSETSENLKFASGGNTLESVSLTSWSGVSDYNNNNATMDGVGEATIGASSQDGGDGISHRPSSDFTTENPQEQRTKTGQSTHSNGQVKLELHVEASSSSPDPEIPP